MADQSDRPVHPCRAGKTQPHSGSPGIAGNFAETNFCGSVRTSSDSEEIDQFIKKPDFPALVDQLLASPRFGERWGRHWLDLARYADSTGGGASNLLPDAWKYRDYVIAAFNRDLPFDQFVTEQIAGDRYGGVDAEQFYRQLVATGFLVLGPKNYINDDAEVFLMDSVDEQIDTVGRVFLGMTLGCARCHDHKFDPVPMKDYYALARNFHEHRVIRSDSRDHKFHLERGQ